MQKSLRHVILLGCREEVNELMAAISKVRGRGVVIREFCSCPCHFGKSGRFHCWSACCIAPNLLYASIVICNRREGIPNLATR
jgi:hypothetical protein